MINKIIIILLIPWGISFITLVDSKSLLKDTEFVLSGKKYDYKVLNKLGLKREIQEIKNEMQNLELAIKINEAFSFIISPILLVSIIVYRFLIKKFKLKESAKQDIQSG